MLHKLIINIECLPTGEKAVLWEKRHHEGDYKNPEFPEDVQSPKELPKDVANHFKSNAHPETIPIDADVQKHCLQDIIEDGKSFELILTMIGHV
jgi:hypothetical protein